MAKPTGKAFIQCTNNAGLGKVGERVGGPPPDEREHFYQCPECDQAIDKRDLGQVLYHATPGQKPLPEN
jgi:hypothetical protein